MNVRADTLSCQPSHAASVLAEPWASLDDVALLEHFRSPRPVDVPLVVDAAECSPRRLDGIMQGRFEFNGEAHALADPIDWLANPSADLEWHIVLHKFYFAAGLGERYLATGDPRVAMRWAALIDGWMRQVPVGFIAADVTGRRVQNWIYSLRAFVAHGVPHVAPVEPAFHRRLLESLHAQVEYLCAHLTPKRNHRTLELHAIFLAGVALPEMARAAYWRRFAMEQTVDNMRADLLPDGVHCELSTDYHHLALRNWLHVRSLAARHGMQVPPEVDAMLERALEFSLHVHKPDGSIPSLSDGDVRSFLPLLAEGARLFGREDMRWVATRGAQGVPPADTLVHFPASGYTVLRSGWGSSVADFSDAQHLVFDCGPLGEGNHGHFDALNFELAAFGRSLVVDPGRYTYSEAGEPNWRVHFRSTAAHNTVCIDGRDQTRYVPGGGKASSGDAPGSVRHRIAGPAPDTTLLECVQAPGFSLVRGRAASHEYDAVHSRTVVGIGGGYWILADRLTAGVEHEYVLNFQLGEAAQGASRLVADAGWRLDSPGLVVVLAARAGQHAELAEGWVSPSYGYKHPAPALRCRVRAASTRFDALLWPWRGAPPATRARWTELTSARGARASLLELALPEGANGMVTDYWLASHDECADDWRMGTIGFHGRWLHLRRGAAGGIVEATSHIGARLTADGRPVPLRLAEVRA